MNDRVEERVKDTCLWFLKHEHYQKWLEQESGPLLVTADPGCGKSVLAKYLIDHGLPRSATICYFFFKDQDQNTSRQALCALLHQLFSQKPPLIRHAMPQFRTDGAGLISSTGSLWKILRNAITDPQAGPIIIVLDALDECAESEFADLMRNVESQFRSDHLSISKSKLKYLLTCRPYEQITSKFQDLLNSFPNIRIPGEEESEVISKEVNHVITYRVNQLSLSPQIKNYLEKRLQETPHRTYLWVYLIFDYIKQGGFKKTLQGAESTISTLPRSVNEAYEQILNKSKEDPMVRKALSIILAASRPLTISEMNIAMDIKGTTQTFHDLDLEDESDFKSRLRSWCGLFISIYHGKVYFLHQTAREFLLSDLASPTTIPSALHWHHSITTQEANNVLAELCVLYLDLFNSSVSLTIEADGKASHSTDSNAFLNYSAENWGAHFREAHIIDGATIIPVTLRICDPCSKSYSAWFTIYQRSTYKSPTGNLTDLIIASYYGHGAVVKLLVKRGADLEAKDRDGRTPLSWAAENGHEAIAKLLVEKGAHLEVKDKDGRTPLSWAAENGHEAIAKLLVEKGAHLEVKDRISRTPLLWAAEKGHEAIAKLLVDKGADFEVKDRDGRTPLLWAAAKGHEAIAKLLVDKGAHLEVKDRISRTPLLWAAAKGHEAIAKLLVDKGADFEVKDRDGRTPLSFAAENGHEAIAKLLVEKGAHLEVKDRISRTPLLWAAAKGHEAIAKLLVEKGAHLEVKDEDGRTPLSWAAENGHEAIAKLLVEKGAHLEVKDEDGRTPLSWAAENGHEAIAKLLVEKGAYLEVKDRIGRTPLLWAAEKGHEAIAKLLVEKGAYLEVKDRIGRTPLLWAAEKGHEAIAKLLVEKGAYLEVKDRISRTPLLWAAAKGHEAIAKLLVEKGAHFEVKDKYGRTPLSLAAAKGHEAIAKLLVEKGAHLEVKDKYGWTPLLWAAENSHEAIAKLLVEKGADFEVKDKYGQTPLLLAAGEGHEAIVKLLHHKM
ncbi:LOW QUALITY PROTEIN: hypothetical protein N5P37_005643 [Trichoderma harzianum]|nr:LOW QUALITY PROTEIN: hypothetical protein N5P37_005643 [Trichoderma harzianum]